MSKTYQTTSVTVKYEQDPDCSSDEYQFLEVSTDNCGGGDFYVIKTDRWAFDSIDELIDLLKDFQSRAKKEEQ